MGKRRRQGVFEPIPLLDKLGIDKLFDRERIYAVNDNFAPSPIDFSTDLI